MLKKLLSLLLIVAVFVPLIAQDDAFPLKTTFRGDFARSGVYDGDGQRVRPEVAWSNDLARPVRTTPAVADGRVFIGSAKILDQTGGPGTVLPQTIHGGPGRAGGGEELGGLRGLAFYGQRVAIQGDRPLVDALLGRSS